MWFYLKWSVRLIFLMAVAAVLHYNLPQWDTVRISDTYEKRVSPGANRFFWTSGDVGDATSDAARDVFFIQSMRANGKPMVYRNEDRPLLFKFDTANLQARAADLKSPPEAPKWVAIKHYGWRNEYLSIYPNAMAIKPVAGPQVQVVPWVSIAALIGILMVVWAITSRIVRFSRRRVAPVIDSIDETVDGWRAKLRRK